MRGMFRSGGPYHLHALRSHRGLSWLQLQNEEVFGVQAPNREQSGLTRGGEKRWGKVWPSFGQQTNRHGRKVNNFPQYVHQVISQLPIFSTISKIIQKTYKNDKFFQVQMYDLHGKQHHCGLQLWPCLLLKVHGNPQELPHVPKAHWKQNKILLLMSDTWSFFSTSKCWIYKKNTFSSDMS